jgi:hypothetical protein
MQVAAERVAFNLKTSSWDCVHHRMEIAFSGARRDRRTVPAQLKENLDLSIESFADLDEIRLPPPIASYICGFAQSRQATASHPGNLWHPDVDDVTSAVGDR